ncbi:hypothetical protein FRC09_001590 [Ceratobasidium sp. 395]|nr:hypothetical protein FRC09_001590 [Ceratobasidium sp. 395]
MENGTLPEYIAKNPTIDRPELCAQISTGLAYLHTSGVVHGDIKGANVLISASGLPKLSDFGNAVLKKYTLQFTGGTTSLNVSMRWTAPELLTGGDCFTKEADVFGLGMIFFEVMTGKLPFHDKPEHVACALIIGGKTPGIPNDTKNVRESVNLLGHVMHQCWSFDAADRPSASQVEQQRTLLKIQDIGSVLASSRALQRNSIPIVFPSDWKDLKGPVFDWYRALPCQHINGLQIRKDSSGAIPHRFINSGEILAAGIFGSSAIEAVDEIEAVELSAWPNLEKETRCEVDLNLGESMDILTVLSACYEVSRDASAHNYALLQFNCYFFSWTILAIVARRGIPNSIPSADQIYDRLQPRLQFLTRTLAGELSHAVMQAALDTITAVRREAGTWTIWKGSNWIDKIIWSLPMSVFRFLMKNLMFLRLHPSLKPHIQKQLFSALGPKLQLMLQSKLHAHLIPDNVHNSLWFSEVRHIVEHAIRAETTNTIWDVIWNTVGRTGLGIDMFQVTQEVSQARFAEGHPGNEAQFSALWNAAIYVALGAVYRSAHGEVPGGAITRETIFDDAWCTARDSALLAAQAIVQDTEPKLNNPKRDVMWEKVWEAWGPAWGAA